MIDRRLFLRSAGAVAGAGALGAVLAACGQGGNGGSAGNGEDDGGPKNMRMAWWGHAEMHRTTNEAIDLYEARNDGITIDPESASWDDFQDRLATQIAGNNGPDLIQMSNQFITDYAQRGALLDLEQFIGDPIDISSWDPDLQNYGLIGGIRAGIPISTDAFTALADLEVLNRLGLSVPDREWNWGDLEELGLSVRDASNEEMWGMTDASGAYEVLEAWVRGRGKRWFNAEDDPVTVGFDREDLAEFWEWWTEMRESGACVTPDVQAEISGHETSPIITGLAPIYFTTSSELTGVRALTTSPLQALPLPDTEGASKRANFVRPNLFISAWEGTDYPMECARFMDFWINDPEAVEVIGNSRGVPPSPDSAALVRDDPDPDGLRTPQEYVDFIREVGDPLDYLTPRGGREVYSILSRTAEELRFGQTNISGAVDNFFEQAESALA